MKATRFVVDELPLTKDIICSTDYMANIIYSKIGTNLLSLLNENGCKIFTKNYSNDFKSIFISSSINNLEYMSFFRKKIGEYFDNLMGIEQILKHNVESIDERNLTIVSITFTNSRYCYIFSQAIETYKFNIITPHSFQLKNYTCKKIVLANSNDDKIEFIKSDSSFVGICLYLFRYIDQTQNTVFKNTLINYLKKFKSFKRSRSGIECILITTNKKSPYYENVQMREVIYSNIDLTKIYEKLSNCIAPSNFYNNKKMRFESSTTFLPPITISYDNYYPNHAILKNVKKQLYKNLGLKVNLIETSFRNVSNTCDFRLHLCFNRYSNPNVMFYNLGLISPLRENRENFLEYFGLMNDYLDFFGEKPFPRDLIENLITSNSLFLSFGEITNNSFNRNSKDIYGGIPI